MKKLWELARKYPSASITFGFLLMVALVSLGTLKPANLDSPPATIEPIVNVSPDLPVDIVLTTEQAKKVVEDKSTEPDCNRLASAGEPGTENDTWRNDVKTPVIQAYREKGQEVTTDNENALYELSRVSSYITEIDKASEQEARERLQSYISDYAKFYPSMTNRTAEIAIELGATIYHPAFVERARTKCASLYREAGMEEDKD